MQSAVCCNHGRAADKRVKYSQSDQSGIEHYLCQSECGGLVSSLQLTRIFDPVILPCRVKDFLLLRACACYQQLEIGNPVSDYLCGLEKKIQTLFCIKGTNIDAYRTIGEPQLVAHTEPLCCTETSTQAGHLAGIHSIVDNGGFLFGKAGMPEDVGTHPGVGKPPVSLVHGPAFERFLDAVRTG